MSDSEILSITSTFVQNAFSQFLRDVGGNGLQHAFERGQLRYWLNNGGRNVVTDLNRRLNRPITSGMPIKLDFYPIRDAIDGVRQVNPISIPIPARQIQSPLDLMLAMMEAIIHQGELGATVGSGDDVYSFYNIVASTASRRDLAVFAAATFGPMEGKEVWIKNKGRFVLNTPDEGYNFCFANAVAHVSKRPKCFESVMKEIDRPIYGHEVENLLGRLRKKRVLNSNVYVGMLYKRDKFVLSPIGTPTRYANQRIVFYGNHVYIATSTVEKVKKAVKRYQCEYCGKDYAISQRQSHTEKCMITHSRTIDNLATRDEYPVKEIYLDPTQWDKKSEGVYTQIKDVLFKEKKSYMLRGPGGCGKSWLIDRIQKEHPNENIQMMAPTAKVAEEYGGKTIHSVFRWPQILKRSMTFWKTEAKKEDVEKLWKGREWGVFIFDETSMIPAHMIDIIDHLLRLFYGKDELMGGIPSVFFGDEGQLPPICEYGGYQLFITSKVFNELVYYHVHDELNFPRRLAIGCRTVDGSIDLPRLQHEFNLLEEVRRGECSDELIKYLETRRTNDDQLRRILIENESPVNENIIAVSTNKQISMLIEMIAEHFNMERIGSFNGLELYAYEGMRAIITDNGALSNKLPDGSPAYPNGTSVIIKSWKVDEYVIVEKNGVLLKIESGSGYNVEKGDIALVPFNVQTMHRMQGATIQGKIYWLYNSENIKAIRWDYYDPGWMYVLMSRPTTLKNLYVVCTPQSDFQRVLSDRIRAFDVVKRKLHDVMDPIPIRVNIGDKECGYALVSDDKPMYYNFDRVDIATASGEVKDRSGLENSMVLHNTIIMDWETTYRVGQQIDELMGSFNAVYYCFYGEFVDLWKMVEGFGYNRYMPKYTFDEVNRCMLFDFDTSDDPGYEYGRGYCELATWIRDERDRYKKIKKKDLPRPFQIGYDRYIFVKTPIMEISYNGGGFDLYFMLNYLASESDLDTMIIPTGSSIKMFSIHDNDGNPITEMYDTMLATGPGSLSSKLKSFVKDNVDAGNYGQFLPWIMMVKETGTFPDGYVIDEHWNQLSEEDKLESFRKAFEEKNWEFTWHDPPKDIGGKFKHQMQTRAKKFKWAATKLWKGIDFLKGLVSNGKKGCVPLKYFSECGKEAWRMKSFDLKSYMMRDGEIDFSRAFFKREIEEARKMYERDNTCFDNYNLKQAITEYGRQDVILTLLLALSLNHNIYFGGDDEENAPAFQFKHSWSGRRVSCLRFKTAASVSSHNMFCNIPEMERQDFGTKKTITSTNVITPEEVNKELRKVPGGKTQARRAHYELKTNKEIQEQSGTVLDKSGLYMVTMKEMCYPCGNFEIFTMEHSPEKIEDYQMRMDMKDEKLILEPLFFIGIAKHDAHETENIFSYKLKEKTRLERTNNEHEAVMFACKLKIMYPTRTQFQITKIVKWERMSPLTRGIMTYYDNAKRQAEERGDSAGRTLVKLSANGTFGKMCQDNKDDAVFIAHTMEEYVRILEKCPLDCEPRVTETPNNFLVTMKSNELGRNTLPWGRAILDESKVWMFKVFNIALGENRYSRSRKVLNEEELGYGDTDSGYFPKAALDRLIEYDRHQPEEKKVLFDSTSDQLLKAGRLTVEIADDVKKYLPKEHADYLANDPTFPCIMTGYYPRYIGQWTKAAKTGVWKYLFPPAGYDATTCPPPTLEEWTVGYCCKMKGVRDGSVMRLNDDKDVWDGIPSYEGPDFVFLENSKECAEMMIYAYEYDIPIEAHSGDTILRKKFHLNNQDKRKGIKPFSIISVQDEGKKVWLGDSNIGRQRVLKKKYEGWDPKKLRNIKNSEKYESFTVPYGYPIRDLED